jgi:hypothetical protein
MAGLQVHNNRQQASLDDIYHDLDTVKLEHWRSQEVAIDIVQCNTTGGGTTEFISSNTVDIKRRFVGEWMDPGRLEMEKSPEQTADLAVKAS